MTRYLGEEGAKEAQPGGYLDEWRTGFLQASGVLPGAVRSVLREALGRARELGVSAEVLEERLRPRASSRAPA